MALKKWVLSSSLLFLFIELCISIDIITPPQSLKDGDLLVSSSEEFALGFFSPANSRNRYVGIWYKKLTERTVVWVANRDNPINCTSGVLSINEDGNLVIYDGNNNQMVPLWQTNISSAQKTTDYSARLLDSGNLVLLGGNNIGRRRSGGVQKLWQSFDYPTNTLLPGMKLGLDRRTGLDRFLTSWKSADNPSTGEYSYRVDTTGLPQLAILDKGSSVPRFRSIPLVVIKSRVGQVGFLLNVTYLDNEDEVSIHYEPINASVVTINVLDEFGFIKIGKWLEDAGRWGFHALPKDDCDKYGYCGVNQLCDSNTDVGLECACLPGYETGRNRYTRYESAGCVKKRESISMCGNGEGFIKIVNVGVPDALSSKASRRRELRLEECREECLRECSCTAFTSSKGDCVTWHGNLMDTRIYSGGVDLYVRVDAIELAQHLKRSRSPHGKRLAIVITSGVLVLLLIVSLVSWMVRKNAKRDAENTSKLLPWKKRLDIIIGVARGVLYLHQDSRLRVIHRDLKPSNILLDYEMNPKISDFGLAKTFGSDQVTAKTRRVVGTYGYMSPEYAIDGLFSIKSDVFSFGVIVLEIISGKRNRMYHHSDYDLSLLGHAWKLWIEGRALELLDPILKDGTIPISEVLKCIQIGLLCVQKCPRDRLTMSSVLLMLVTENAILPQPKQPGFYTERISNETHYQLSINDVTMTQVEAR